MWHHCWNVFLWIVVLAAGSACGTNPGFKFRLSQTGLNYVANVAVDILADRVRHITIHDYTGSAKAGGGKVDYTISNIKVTDFKKPSTSIMIEPGRGLTWAISNGAISIHGDWSYRYRLKFIDIRDHGSFDGYTDGVSLSLSVSLGMDAGGHPTISESGCTCNVNTLKITLHARFAWFYNLFKDQIEKMIRKGLEENVCTEAKKAINENGTRELATLPVQVVVDKLWLFDYRLVAAPLFATGYLESYHKGEFFFSGDLTDAPFQPNPFAPSATEQMVSIWMSDYVLNTVGYVLYKHNVLHHVLTKDDLSQDMKGYLNTTCNSIECFGFLVPQVSKLFPNASVEMEMIVTTRPTVQIAVSGVIGNFAGIINYRARLSNGSFVDLFKTTLSVGLSLSVVLENMIVKGKVEKFTSSITVTESKVGPISSLILNGVFSLAAKIYVIPKLDAVGQKGIPIPVVKNVRFVNTQLHFEDHNIRLATDVVYAPTTTLFFERSR